MRLILIVFLLFNVGLAHAQKSRTFTVTGKVTTCGDQPVERVSVMVYKKTIGMMTDANGLYTLRGITNGDSLIFTHVSYKPAFVSIKNNSTVNVRLEKSVYTLNTFVEADSVKKIEGKDMANTSARDERSLEKVEIFPSFPGGQPALFRYLQTALSYPPAAKEKETQGIVLVGFTVGIKGEIKNVKLLRGISPECDEAALNCIRNMPLWVCAIQNGKAVEADVELPIQFSLIEK